MERGLAVSFLCLWCVGCASETLAESPSVTTGIAYGRESELALTMDIYQPEHANGAGVIFLMSGGWRSLPQRRQWITEDGGVVRLATDDELGDRLPLVASFRFRPLLERGFTVFAVYHRNSPKFRMPEIVDNVRRALRFIGGRAGEYNIDRERLGLWGVSSGGHLALVLATSGDPDLSVAAVVAYSAPTDLKRALHAPVPRNPALALSDEEYQAFSPFRHVSSAVPPTLFVHGAADELVDIREGRSMYRALLEQGVETRLVIIPRTRHRFVDEAAEVALSEAVEWFERYLGPSER